MKAAEARPGRVVAGVVFSLVGVGFLLESVGVWRVDLVYLWPLVLIGVGVSLVLGRARRIRFEEDRAARLAVAEERVRLARELHDIVAHGVSLMTIQITAARRAAKAQPEAADEALAAAEQAGRQSLAELRSLLGVLRSADVSLGEARSPQRDEDAVSSPSEEAAPTAPLPRVSDIPALVSKLRGAGLDARLEIVGEGPPRVAPGTELAAYRIVQESLTNVLRHAPRARVLVALSYGRDTIEIVVDDDGDGVRVPAGSGGGHGILGMRERAAAGGGTLTAGPREGGSGWRVRAQLPLRKWS